VSATGANEAGMFFSRRYFRKCAGSHARCTQSDNNSLPEQLFIPIALTKFLCCTHGFFIPALCAPHAGACSLISVLEMGASTITGKIGNAECGTRPGSFPGAPSLEVNVIFTSDQGTRAALRTAGNLARQLNAGIRLLVTQVVPYTLPLEHPKVSVDFVHDRCRRMASECPEVAEIRINVYLCRDRCQVLRRVLSANSLVIVGGKRRWWPTTEQKLMKVLQAEGHHVIFADLRSDHLPANKLAERLAPSDRQADTQAKLACDDWVRTKSAR
jgi:hypothetical protein